ncbi:MAG: permease-like cell division protein FtsX [Bacteroidota bacterium]|nr:permease-like cell division protein FtsX [Bacteroidota bacterium]
MSDSQERFNLRRLKTSYLTTIISISLVLFMLGLLSLLILHARKLSDYVKGNIGFSVILKENAKEVEIKELQKKLDASDFVKSTNYINKDEAARILQKDLGEEFLNFLGYNPLSASLDIHLNPNYANNDSLSIIEQRLMKKTIVKEVVYQKNIVTIVNENIRKISIIILFFSSLLMIIAIALINNTIRLSVYSKRFLIKSMQLVGATQGFIRKPFVFKGIMQGIYGALISIILLMGLIYIASKEIPELFVLKDIRILLIIFSIVIVLGIILSWISTFFAVRKYLKIKTDYLYY